MNTIALLEAFKYDHLLRRSYAILNSHRQRIKEEWAEMLDHPEPEKLAFRTILKYDTPFILAHFTVLKNITKSLFFYEIFEDHVPKPNCCDSSQDMADWIDSINLYTEDDEENDSLSYHCESYTLKNLAQYLRNGSHIDEFIGSLGNRIWRQFTNEQKNLFRQIVFIANLDFFILPQIQKTHYESLCGKSIVFGTDDDWETFTKDDTFTGFDAFGVSKPFELSYPSNTTLISNIGPDMTAFVNLFDFDDDGVAIETWYNYQRYYRFLVWPEHYTEMVESLF